MPTYLVQQIDTACRTMRVVADSQSEARAMARSMTEVFDVSSFEEETRYKVICWSEEKKEGSDGA